MSATEELLSSLLDVESVVGSFAGDNQGELLVNAMPAFFDTTDLTVASIKLTAMFDCAEECELLGHTALLQFSEYLLHVCRLEHGILCVLANPEVNFSSLRMATKLVGRRLPKLLANQNSAEPQREPPPLPAQFQTSTSASNLSTGDTGQTLPSVPSDSTSAQRSTNGGGPPEAQPASSQASRTIVYRGRRYKI